MSDVNQQWLERDYQKRKRFAEAIRESTELLSITNPNAKLIFIRDRQGQKTHFGLFDFELSIDPKWKLRSEQPLPILLGDLVPYNHCEVLELGALAYVNAWSSAYWEQRPKVMQRVEAFMLNNRT